MGLGFILGTLDLDLGLSITIPIQCSRVFALRMIEKRTIINILASTLGLSNHEFILKFGKNFSVKTVSTVEPVQGIPHLILRIVS